MEYALTPLGESFLATATSIVDWAATHHDVIRENRIRSGVITAEATSATIAAG